MAEEVASLFAAMADPQVFLVHDINFHRAVAAASGNPIVASLVEMVSALYYERRRDTAARASDRDMRDAAEMHRRIYQAIRSHDADEARRAMQTHLMQASAHQARESDSEPAPRANGSAARNGSATRSRRVKSQPSSH
jgi:GntR family transcriptional repressor for pyruvate dehydrogenase complex